MLYETKTESVAEFAYPVGTAPVVNPTTFTGSNAIVKINKLYVTI